MMTKVQRKSQKGHCAKHLRLSIIHTLTIFIAIDNNSNSDTLLHYFQLSLPSQLYSYY